MLLIAAICAMLLHGVSVNIRYDSKTGVKLVFTLLNISFPLQKWKKKRSGRGASFVFGALTRLPALIRTSEVTLRRLSISESEDTEEYERYFERYKYQAVISAFLAYLKQNTKKLTVYDDAFIIDPDGDSRLYVDLTVSLRLFYFIKAYAYFWLHECVFKRKRKRKRRV